MPRGLDTGSVVTLARTRYPAPDRRSRCRRRGSRVPRIRQARAPRPRRGRRRAPWRWRRGRPSRRRHARSRLGCRPERAPAGHGDDRDLPGPGLGRELIEVTVVAERHERAPDRGVDVAVGQPAARSASRTASRSTGPTATASPAPGSRPRRARSPRESASTRGRTPLTARSTASRALARAETARSREYRHAAERREADAAFRGGHGRRSGVVHDPPETAGAGWGCGAGAAVAGLGADGRRGGARMAAGRERASGRPPGGASSTVPGSEVAGRGGAGAFAGGRTRAGPSVAPRRRSLAFRRRASGPARSPRREPRSCGAEEAHRRAGDPAMRITFELGERFALRRVILCADHVHSIRLRASRFSKSSMRIRPCGRPAYRAGKLDVKVIRRPSRPRSGARRSQPQSTGRDLIRGRRPAGPRQSSLGTTAPAAPARGRLRRRGRSARRDRRPPGRLISTAPSGGPWTSRPGSRARDAEPPRRRARAPRPRLRAHASVALSVGLGDPADELVEPQRLGLGLGAGRAFEHQQVVDQPGEPVASARTARRPAPHAPWRAAYSTLPSSVVTGVRSLCRASARKRRSFARESSSEASIRFSTPVS